MDKFQNIYRIPSARATFHNYCGGIYFITICTQNREYYFGKIINSEMHLTAVGRHTEVCIQNIEHLHNGVFVPIYVVMPNHVHLIIIIDRKNSTPSPVETSQCGVSTIASQCGVFTTEKDKKSKKMQQIALKCGLLSHVVGRFKAAVTRFARQNNIDFAWQTRFHDRVVRGGNELNSIAEYIENNIVNWQNDELFVKQF